MVINPQQVQQIIQNAPAGTDPQAIINGLVSRGHIVQGVNDESVQHDNTPLYGKIGNFLGSLFGGKQIGEAIGTAVANQTPAAQYLKNAPAIMHNGKQIVAPGNGQNPIQGPSGEQIAGDVLQSGLSIGAPMLGGIGGEAAGALGRIGTTAAVGAGFGGAGAMENNQNIGGVAKGALGGAAIGGVLGGAVEGVNALAQKGSQALGNEANKLANPELQATKTLNNKFSPKDIETMQKQASLYEGSSYAEKAATGTKVTQGLETARNSSLESLNISVPKQTLIDKLTALKGEDFVTTDTTSGHRVANAIDKTIENITNTQGEHIPLTTVNKFKMNAAADAFPEFGSKVSNELANQIRSVYQKTIEDSADLAAFSHGNTNIQVPAELQKYVGGKAEMPIGEFNAEFQKNVRATQALKKVAEPKPGLVSQLTKKALAGGAGAAVGSMFGPLGSFAGGAAGLGAEHLLDSPTGKQILIKGFSLGGKSLGKIKIPASLIQSATVSGKLASPTGK